MVSLISMLFSTHRMEFYKYCLKVLLEYNVNKYILNILFLNRSQSIRQDPGFYIIEFYLFDVGFSHVGIN